MKAIHSIRMTLPAIPLLALSTLIYQPSTSFAQGSLTPSGPPAPTMKTLEQLEPRVDVMTLPGDASSHVILSNAGSYYLSTNLAVTKSYGITIAAAGVTLDLNGFEIARVSGSGGDGIRISGGSDRAAVRNGTIRGFSYGINGNLSPYTKGCLFEQLAVTGCSTYGLYAGESARVLDCRAHDNAGSGIYANQGAVITGCTAQTNRGTYGIFGGVGSTISGSAARNNQAIYGIYGEAGSTISGCAAYGNVGTGISSYGIYGYIGSTIIACVSQYNGNTNSPGTALQGVGIAVNNASLVKDCNAAYNKGDGIRVMASCLVEGNNSYVNGSSGDGAGIHSTGVRNRIEANSVTGNVRGIDVDSTASLILRNSASNNTTNYTIATGNRYGPIVDITAGGAAAVNGNSAASTLTSTDPWANFSH